MLEISETFGKVAPTHLHEDGKILVSHKPLVQKVLQLKQMFENSTN